MNANYPSLFQPINIGKLHIKNRLVVPPIGTLFSGYDGHTNDRLIDFHTIKAKGGWGLIIAEGVAVHKGGKGGPKQYGIWDDSFIPEYKRLVDSVHEQDAKIALQIMHAGRNTRPEITEGQQPVAPSAIPDPIIRVEPKELTKTEIKEIIEYFVEAARRAKEAGFDAVELHGGHGYLVSEFMSGYANKRQDEYGGSLEGFVRFPIEIIKGIKENLGKDYPIIFRISVDEVVPEGRKIEESVKISKRLVEEGADAIHASIGVYQSSFLTMAPPSMEQGFNVNAAYVIKNAVSVPVIAVGRINDPDLAHDIISSGKADMVALGRQSVADPEWPLKVAENRLDEIVKCLSCNEGCLDTAWGENPINCVQNPTVGKETDYASYMPAKLKKVIIAGGGPAGLEAARIAALFGHDVTLYEKETSLGGQINIASKPPSKDLLNEVALSREKSLNQFDVKINLGKELTPELIKEMSPDVLIIATGSETLIPEIPGIGHDNVLTARDVLKGADVGDKLLIIGGGIVGCETADYLSQQGKDVTIVEMLKYIARDISPASRYFLLKRLNEKNVKIKNLVTVNEIIDDGVIISSEKGEEKIDTMDNIIIATGARSINKLEAKIQNIVTEIYVIGDAQKPGKILDAIQQASDVGMSL